MWPVPFLLRLKRCIAGLVKYGILFRVKWIRDIFPQKEPVRYIALENNRLLRIDVKIINIDVKILNCMKSNVIIYNNIILCWAQGAGTVTDAVRRARKLGGLRSKQLVRGAQYME